MMRHRLVAPLVLISSLSLALACGSSDGDTSGGDDTGDEGDGDTTAGDGDSTAGDGDGTAGDGDGAPGDGDGATGGTVGDGDGDGPTELTGPCYDEECAGNCAPLDDGGPTCGGRWECQQVLTCSRDLAQYCGCNGETIQGSSNCVSMQYAHEGACPDGGDGDGGDGNGIAGGLNCDGSQVVTDDLPPQCEPGQIPQVVGGGWGSCVPLGDCGCENSGSQDQCGDGLSYICYNDNRCGDLVN